MFSAFVNFGDIKGEVTEKDHKDWVAATKVAYGLRHPASTTQQTGGGRTAEAVEFSEYAFDKLIDKASPTLFEAAVRGTTIPEVTIHYSRASGDSPVVYLEVKLKEVLISGIQHLADPSGPQQFPTEEIRMTFGTIETTYIQETSAGKKGGNVAAKYDLTKGEAT